MKIENETRWDRFKDWLEFDVLYFITEPFKNWIWPARKIKRLMDRHDIVKLPSLKATEWCDVTERMYLAVMELVKNFVEKERPEEVVEWYADGGEHGYVSPKYGDNKNDPIYAKEYEGMWIMDLIKMIYQWYIVDEKKLDDDIKFLMDVWFDNLAGTSTWKYDEDSSEYYRLEIDKSRCAKSVADLKEKGVDIDRLVRILKCNKDDLLKDDFIFKKINELEQDKYLKRQKMLHICIDIREYLWT